jgi:anti-sigma factor RsiW
MSSGDEYRLKILRYMDNDLQGQELNDFLTHLEVCADCRSRLGAEWALSHLLHRSRPLYSAPAALRSRVSAIVMHHSESPARIGFLQTTLQMLQTLADPSRRVLSTRMLALVVLLLGFLFAFVPNVIRQVRAASYVETAVATHRSYLDCNRPLALRTSSPELVTAWFTDKVPFQFRLPNAQSAPNGPLSYRLTGASLVNYRGNPAALVIYEKESQTISLLVASSKSAVVAGGDEVRFSTLTFHYRTDDGFKVITWSHHGLSYALVSNVSGSAQESCLVCHQTWLIVTISNRASNSTGVGCEWARLDPGAATFRDGAHLLALVSFA